MQKWYSDPDLTPKIGTSCFSGRGHQKALQKYILGDVIQYESTWILLCLCFSVTSSRENMTYTVDCLRDDM